MVSIFSSHFFNWVKQLEGAGHEVYWLDVKDSKTVVKDIDFVNQIVGWRYKFDYPGRYFIKDKLPKVNSLINIFNERSLSARLEKLVKEIQPDVIHSFVMYLSAVPILEVMRKYENINWIYSSWGSDLFYYSRFRKERDEMMKVFPYLDYMFADCYRDYSIALKLGFKGKFLGVYPGRGGYDLKATQKLSISYHQRKKILIKGYQGKHGRCIQVLKAIKSLKNELNGFQIVVFGADEEVVKSAVFLDFMKWENFTYFKQIENSLVLKLMGESLIFIGNSASDGMPNTLLESIIMGAFPIQSNPGGATSEMITDGENGLLINNPEDETEIALLIEKAIKNMRLLKKAYIFNSEIIRPKLERDLIRKEVLKKYESIQLELFK